MRALSPMSAPVVLSLFFDLVTATGLKANPERKWGERDRVREKSERGGKGDWERDRVRERGRGRQGGGKG